MLHSIGKFTITKDTSKITTT